ncbi:MAG: helix-turn-helix domain-containing protein [Chloroflexi bacterium]|nr:helix-turn-helix domain-containing protein [Chloroflexota bacterium]
MRRVTSNWREYAGLVMHGRAKEQIANEIENPSGVLYDTGRAVFSLELLYAVAKTQEERSVTTRPTKSVSPAHIFSLSFLTFCARCDQLARAEDNPKFRTRITGHNKKGQLRYRHSDSHKCDCKTKSVPVNTIEEDFARLIHTLEVHPDAIELMAELAVQTRFGGAQDNDDLQEQKKVAIAKHKRAIKNNFTLFQNGEIDSDEYYRQKDYHERQIAYWEAQTTDKQKIALELTTCVEMINRLKTFWEITDGEDRRLLAHSLFDEIVYDLDKRQIVDFTMKSWAEPFLVLRATLYFDALSEEMKNRFNSGLMASSNGLFHDPNGLSRHKSLQLSRIIKAAHRCLQTVYPHPCTYEMRFATKQRNELIAQKYQHGQGLSDIAREFGISPQRIYQIIHDKKH